MLEDFKIMHDYFGIKKLISLENDPEVYKRQGKNKPFSCIRCLNTSSDQYINNYSSKNNSIFWLDYAESKAFDKQFKEFQNLLPKLSAGDIIKITLNVEMNSLSRTKKHNKEAREKILKLIEQQIGDYIDPNTTYEDITEDNLPKLILKAFGVACGEIMQGLNNYDFIPLLTTTYKDSHQMMTITGIFIEKKSSQEFLEKTGLTNWEYYTGGWKNIIEIKLPELTIREKFFIDILLPKSNMEQVKKSLGYLLDEDSNISDQKIESYIKFYRFYPNFTRVLV
jgi:hypothetical protein